MNADHPLSLLIYMTFAAVAIVAIIMLLRFTRKGERHPMAGERERTGEEIARDAAPETDTRP